jgi:hypothetical protein
MISFYICQAIWPYSGHYQPTEENFLEFVSFLEDHHVSLTDVKVISSVLSHVHGVTWLAMVGPNSISSL